VLAFAACAAAPGTIQRTATPTIIVVPTVLPNGRVELAIQPRYVLGRPTRIEVAIVATRGTIAGPTQARVMASGINEGGAPAEVLVRRLDTTSAIATADRRDDVRDMERRGPVRRSRAGGRLRAVARIRVE
jgi:hypothetical protein